MMITSRRAAPILFATSLMTSLLICVSPGALAQADCPIEAWSERIVDAWFARSMLSDEMTACYAERITSMEIARELRDQVIANFDRQLPRAAYKVVGLDPVNAALDGVDRPMVGAMYVSQFLPNGSAIPLDSAKVLITEPDILFRVSDAAINEATTLEEALPHIDRVYAFIEVPAPLFNNSPPNPFLMQASNLLPRWGVIGENIAVENTPQFLRSLETMRVRFINGDGEVLTDVTGDYLGGNPLHGVLVVLGELKRRGERLLPGDLVSSGSFMPPILVEAGMVTETVYEGIGGQTLRVLASYRDQL